MHVMGNEKVNQSIPPSPSWDRPNNHSPLAALSIGSWLPGARAKAEDVEVLFLKPRLQQLQRPSGRCAWAKGSKSKHKGLRAQNDYRTCSFGPLNFVLLVFSTPTGRNRKSYSYFFSTHSLTVRDGFLLVRSLHG